MARALLAVGLMMGLLVSSPAMAGPPAACGSQGDTGLATGEVRGIEAELDLWTTSCAGAAVQFDSDGNIYCTGVVKDAGRIRIEVIDGSKCTTGAWLVL